MIATDWDVHGAFRGNPGECSQEFFLRAFFQILITNLLMAYRAHFSSSQILNVTKKSLAGIHVMVSESLNQPLEELNAFQL
jgi:hypothetical protein